MLGQALLSFGGFLIICGLIGRAGIVAINQGRGIAKLPALNGLSAAYPMYPLWWVPESMFGYLLPALLAAVGIYVALTAKGMLTGQETSSRRRRR